MSAMLFFPLTISAAYAEGPDGLSEKTPLHDAGEMILVPAGEFSMGSSGISYPDDEQPLHNVNLSAFYIDRYEVTNAQFAQFLNAVRGQLGEEKRKKWIVIRSDLDDPLKAAWYPAEITYEDGAYSALQGFESYPVLAVSWYGASEYCTWAGKRLPTEAEWEKAARGGREGDDYPWGNQMPTREGGVAFGSRWSDNSLPAPVRMVRSYPSNGLSIFGMAGNVSEWCADWYGPEYYKRSPRRDPKGPDSGTRKVHRGGNWASSAVDVRAAVRRADPPESLLNSLGFRCAKDAETR